MIAALRSLDTPANWKLAIRVFLIAASQTALVWSVDTTDGAIGVVGFFAVIAVGFWLVGDSASSRDRWRAFGLALMVALVWPMCRYLASREDDLLIYVAFAACLSVVTAAAVVVLGGLRLDRWMVDSKARTRNLHLLLVIEFGVNLWHRSVAVSLVFLVLFLLNLFWPERRRSPPATT